MYKITNHKYNLVLKSSKTIIKNINNIDRSIKDYPKYPMFTKDLTTTRSETIVGKQHIILIYLIINNLM